MRATSLGSFVAILVAALVAACGSADDGGAETPSGAAGAGGGHKYDSGTSYGGASSGGGLNYGGAAGAGYAGGGGVGGGASTGGASTGGAGGAPPPVADAGAPPAKDAGGVDSGELDSGKDLCAALDQSKNAVFFLSSDDSNSMASPAIARRLLKAHQQVPPYILRTHEFLNYYNVGYAPADAGKLAITTEMAAGAEAGSYDLQIGVASPAAVKPRRPMVLTFVLDTSGSMQGEPIQLERTAMLAIAAQLKAGDVVNMTTWNTQQQILLSTYSVSGANDAKVVSLANSISASGGTDLSGGLKKGYELATKSFDPNKLNRVVLISDGIANVGITDEKIIGDGAALNDGDGIYLVGVGVGAGVNDTLMNTVTDKGRGAYVYLDTKTEAWNMFGKRFDESMDVAARAVGVELRMPWYMGIEKFFGEEYSTNPEEIEPQHLAPDDAMVMNQIVAPCDATKWADADPVEVVVRWQTPTGHAKQEMSQKTTLGALLASPPKYLGKAKAVIAYAEALKDPPAAKQNLALAKQLATAANPGGKDPELNEVMGLIDQALTIY